MRDAEGIFFGPGKVKGEIGRVTRELGREEGIDYMLGADLRAAREQEGGEQEDVEMISPRQQKRKKKKKRAMV